MNIQDELLKWANETVDVYKHQQTDSGFYTQTPLCNISKLPDLLILGINPGYGGGKDNMTGEELLKGNPCFNGLDDKGIIYVMSEKPDENKKRKGWALWHRLNSMLEYSYNKKNKDLLRDLNRFVLSNMIFYGTEKESQIPKIEREECAKQTMKLITILQPKVVLLLGNQSRKLYDRISSNKLEMLVPNSMYHCMFEKSHVLAIKHTAYYYSSIEMELIGKTIGYLLDYHDETINSEFIRASILKDDIVRFEEIQKKMQLPKDKDLYYLMNNIIAKGCIRGIDNNGNLTYEYYCNNTHNDFIHDNGTISIGIYYQNKQCCLSIITKGNHPNEFLAMVQGICDESKLFKKNGNANFIADVETDISKIVNIFNLLLSKIKKYRETDFPV